MIKKFFIPLLCAVVIGFISAYIFKDFYNSIKDAHNAYLLQIGVYSDDKNLNNDLKYIDKYVTVNNNDLTYVYVGVTTSENNAKKIKDIYDCKNMDIYIKPVLIDNVEFYSNLEQYDILLSNVDKEKDILSINDAILSDYEQMIIKS